LPDSIDQEQTGESKINHEGREESEENNLNENLIFYNYIDKQYIMLFRLFAFFASFAVKIIFRIPKMNNKTCVLFFPFLILAPFLRAGGGFADAVRPYVDNRTLAGAVLLVADKDAVIACEPVGCADIESKAPMRSDSLFWVASMAKPVTAACLMMLVDEGGVFLDDPVEKYIPAFKTPQKIVPQEGAKLNVTNAVSESSGSATASKNADDAARRRQHPITIRHLLCHASGLRHIVPGETVSTAFPSALDRLPLSKRAELYAASDLLFEPGTDYSYANAGVNVAGRVIEIVSGMSYESFLQKRLFDPLGMKDTTFWPDSRQIGRLATSYRGDPARRTLTPRKIHSLSYPLDDRAGRHPIPGGGLFSTARDYACFGQLLLNRGVWKGKRLLSENAIGEMIRHQTPGGKPPYGLCLGNTFNPAAFGHGGAYGTRFDVWPEENLVTVFMVQRQSAWGGPDGKKILPAFADLARKYIRQKHVK
jgi:CubicO group peptidase (beta-lactamase class C family)